jgi:hypothetical protein
MNPEMAPVLDVSSELATLRGLLVVEPVEFAVADPINGTQARFLVSDPLTRDGLVREHRALCTTVEQVGPHRAADAPASLMRLSGVCA